PSAQSRCSTFSSGPQSRWPTATLRASAASYQALCASLVCAAVRCRAAAAARACAARAAIVAGAADRGAPRPAALAAPTRRLPPPPGAPLLAGLADLDVLPAGRALASWTGEANGPSPCCAGTVSAPTGAAG